MATIGGLPIAVIGRAGSAELMIDVALRRRGSGQRPLIFTSANGQVLSMCARDAAIRDLFLDTDLIHADGMPLVFISRLLHRTPLPERVCTTDLFEDVCRIAPRRGVRVFSLGATQTEVDQATQNIRALYPDLDVAGHASDIFGAPEMKTGSSISINAARPDILWLGLGAPNEQRFAVRHRDRLRGVGLIKTSGGLFDYFSGKNSRAPAWMRSAGLEWAYRHLAGAAASRRHATSPPTRTRFFFCSRGPRLAARAIFRNSAERVVRSTSAS